jgi:hypothetical protein
MLEEYHPVEKDLITLAVHNAGIENVHPKAKHQAKLYLRSTTKELAEYFTTIMQHTYATKLSMDILKHAYLLLWRKSEKICDEVNYIIYPEQDDEKDDSDYEEDEESDEEGLEEDENDEENEDEESDDDNYWEQLTPEEQHEDEDFVDALADIENPPTPIITQSQTSSNKSQDEDSMFTKLITQYIKEQCPPGARYALTIPEDVIKAYLSYFLEQLTLSFMSQPW